MGIVSGILSSLKHCNGFVTSQSYIISLFLHYHVYLEVGKLELAMHPFMIVEVLLLFHMAQQHLSII